MVAESDRSERHQLPASLPSLPWSGLPGLAWHVTEPNLKSSFGLPRCLKTGLWTPTETHAWGHSFYNIFFRELTHKLKIDIRVCKLFDFVQIHTYECENSFIVIQVHIYECANSLIGLAHKLKHECEKWFSGEGEASSQVPHLQQQEQVDKVSFMTNIWI